MQLQNPALAGPRTTENPFATAEAWSLPVSKPRRDVQAQGVGAWTVESLLDELRGRGLKVERRGRTWWSQCPCLEHDDQNPSLEVRMGHSAVLAKCQSRCSREAVWKAIGPPPGWSRQPLALHLPDDCLCWWHQFRMDEESAKPSEEWSPSEVAGVVSMFQSLQRSRVRRVVLESKKSPSSTRRHIEGPGPCADSAGDAVVVVPGGLGRVMKLVLADLVDLVNERLAEGEVRAVPYASRWVAERLGLDDGDGRKVRTALERLEERGLVKRAGDLPNRAQREPTPLYALVVRAPCPACPGDVEAGPGVVGLDAEHAAATGDRKVPLQPTGEQPKLAGMTATELEASAGAGFAAAVGVTGDAITAHLAPGYAWDETSRSVVHRSWVESPFA